MRARQRRSLNLVLRKFEHNAGATLARNSNNPSSRKKFGLETVRPTEQGATFSMRGQLHYEHYLSHYVMEGRWRRYCTGSTACVTWIPIGMRQETPADETMKCANSSTEL